MEFSYRTIIFFLLVIGIIFFIIKEVGELKRFIDYKSNNIIKRIDEQSNDIKNKVQTDLNTSINKVKQINSDFIVQIRKMNNYGSQPINNHFSENASAPLGGNYNNICDLSEAIEQDLQQLRNNSRGNSYYYSSEPQNNPTQESTHQTRTENFDVDLDDKPDLQSKNSKNSKSSKYSNSSRVKSNDLHIDLTNLDIPNNEHEDNINNDIDNEIDNVVNSVISDEIDESNYSDSSDSSDGVELELDFVKKQSSPVSVSSISSISSRISKSHMSNYESSIKPKPKIQSKNKKIKLEEYDKYSLPQLKDIAKNLSIPITIKEGDYRRQLKKDEIYAKIKQHLEQ